MFINKFNDHQLNSNYNEQININNINGIIYSNQINNNYTIPNNTMGNIFNTQPIYIDNINKNIIYNNNFINNTYFINNQNNIQNMNTNTKNNYSQFSNSNSTNKNTKEERKLNPKNYLIKMFGRDGWICKFCTNFNFETRNKCNRCQAIKMPKTKEEINKKKEKNKKNKKKVKERKTDWLCLNCQNLNYGFRKNCNRCKIERKEEFPSIYLEPNQKINGNKNNVILMNNFSRLQQIMNNNNMQNNINNNVQNNMNANDFMNNNLNYNINNNNKMKNNSEFGENNFIENKAIFNNNYVNFTK
jgi:hypothetical protein